MPLRSVMVGFSNWMPEPPQSVPLSCFDACRRCRWLQLFANPFHHLPLLARFFSIILVPVDRLDSQFIHLRLQLVGKDRMMNPVTGLRIHRQRRVRFVIGKKHWWIVGRKMVNDRGVISQGTDIRSLEFIEFRNSVKRIEGDIFPSTAAKPFP